MRIYANVMVCIDLCRFYCYIELLWFIIVITIPENIQTIHSHVHKKPVLTTVSQKASVKCEWNKTSASVSYFSYRRPTVDEELAYSY